MGVVLVAWSVGVEGTQERAHAQISEPAGSVAIVANLGGEASISSVERSIPVEAATLQKTIVYGDRLKTGENSVLSMLVGDGALVSMEELSEIAIEEETTSGRLIQLVNGRSCISTKGQGEYEKGAITVQTPNVIVYPRPGSMFSVEVSEIASQKTYQDALLHPVLARFDGTRSHVAPALVQDSSRVQEETIQVIHGSVEVVSQLPGVTPVDVPEGYRVRVQEGIISQPVQRPAVQCQIQDLQKDPQHTNNPEEIQQLIAQQQTAQATNLVAALFVPEPTSTTVSPGDVILPFTLITNDDGSGGERTNSTISAPLPPGSELISTNATANVDVIQVVGPGVLEINETTLTLLDSQVIPSSGNEDITLLTVTSGGLLRGTSTDPVLDILAGSETNNIQSAVQVIDPSLLEASAPLIRATSSSALMTTMDAVQINQGQLVASIPADALALVELNGSTLSAVGSLFNVSNGGILAVNGNLVSLTNGSQLLANNLVALSGGSSFGLTGGSLLFGDGSSTATINNNFCAGGGCTNGFVFAPPNNTISIAPNFQPTQGVNVSPDAALIVVNGTGNTVVLSP